MNGNCSRLALKGPRYYFFALFMTLLLALFMAPAAMAGCKNGKGKCNNPPPPDPTPASIGTSTAFFDEDGNMHVEHSGELGCSTGADLTVASGDYFCNDPLPDFHISTASFTGHFNNKYREICGSLGNTPEAGDHNFAILTSYEFSYGWRDDCTNGSCRIEISMKFKGSQISTETKNKADQLSIVISGWAEETPVDDANPFYLEDVIVDVDTATLEFGLTGKKRSVGLCPFRVDKDDTNQSVTFNSMDP
jgi:hypothetical protein